MISAIKLPKFNLSNMDTLDLLMLGTAIFVFATVFLIVIMFFYHASTQRKDAKVKKLKAAEQRAKEELQARLEADLMQMKREQELQKAREEQRMFLFGQDLQMQADQAQKAMEAKEKREQEAEQNQHLLNPDAKKQKQPLPQKEELKPALDPNYDPKKDSRAIIGVDGLPLNDWGSEPLSDRVASLSHEQKILYDRVKYILKNRLTNHTTDICELYFMNKINIARLIIFDKQIMLLILADYKKINKDRFVAKEVKNLTLSNGLPTLIYIQNIRHANNVEHLLNNLLPRI